MTYLDDWKALSSRIRGLMKAGQLYARFLAVNSSDSYRVGQRLYEQSQSVLSELQSFQDRFRQSLSPAALHSVDRLMERVSRITGGASTSTGLERERERGMLVLLVAFEAEMSFILSDTQETIRARSERAFSHLQRSIVVDSAFQEKWQAAFREGEVACERLGAVHLLLHGIWAFKVNAEGARTDLVFQEPSGDLTNEQRYVDGFVLTEWKKANRERDAEQRFEEARSQAGRYAQGALAGSELTGYRYAVVVST